MKKFVAAICLLSLAAIVASAQGVYSMAVQRAKNAADSQPPAQNGGHNSAPQPAPTNPELQATLKNVSDLQSDFVALGVAADVDSASDQKISLLNHLSAAAQGTKASANSVKTLAKDFVTALAGKKMTNEPRAKFTRDIHALFNSAHLSATQQQTALDEVQKILTGAGVAADAATDVATDLKKIADETK